MMQGLKFSSLDHGDDETTEELSWRLSPEDSLSDWTIIVEANQRDGDCVVDARAHDARRLRQTQGAHVARRLRQTQGAPKSRHQFSRNLASHPNPAQASLSSIIATAASSRLGVDLQSTLRSSSPARVASGKAATGRRH